jgi:hypothetical protein
MASRCHCLQNGAQALSQSKVHLDARSPVCRAHVLRRHHISARKPAVAALRAKQNTLATASRGKLCAASCAGNFQPLAWLSATRHGAMMGASSRAWSLQRAPPRPCRVALRASSAPKGGSAVCPEFRAVASLGYGPLPPARACMPCSIVLQAPLHWTAQEIVAVAALVVVVDHTSIV